MDFFYFLPVFIALLAAYGFGIASVYMLQYLERRWLAHTQAQAELDSEHEEGYTLTLVERPGDLSEGE